MIGLFSFFAGAGFLDLGFEMTGHFKTLFVNEFKPAFNRIYRHARNNMGIEAPEFGHHIGDIAEWLDDKEKNKLLHQYLKDAKNNGIENADFIVGDCALELPKLIKEIGKVDCLVLDPPRAGCFAYPARR